MKPRYDSKNFISSLEEGRRGGEGTCGRGVHDRSETVHRGSLATSATCGGRSRGRPGAGLSLPCARLLGRARVPQAGDLVQRIGPRPFTGELSRGSFCPSAEHGPQPVRCNRRSVRSACDERRSRRLSQEARPAQARRGGNSGAPDRSDRGAVHRDRGSDASARADGGCRNAGRSDEAGRSGRRTRSSISSSRVSRPRGSRKLSGLS